MPATEAVDAKLEAEIDQWRSFLHRRQAIHTVDVAELEDHLRERIAGLIDGGLASDEAFLVAVKRMGALDSLSREFAHEHSERLWKQLVAIPVDQGVAAVHAKHDAVRAFGLAAAAAVALKAPVLFGTTMDGNESFYLRNAALFVFPLLTVYFVWKRGLSSHLWRWLAIAFVIAAVIINVAPFVPAGSTEILAALHLPIALWFVVGVAYAGVRWRDSAGRMDFIRFSGELFIYYVLIALGGGVLTAFMVNMFKTIGLDAEYFVSNWQIPCGAAGAVIVGSWLVEAKQSVIENMAPVLTRLFTPLFTAVLVIFVGAIVWTGRGVGLERDMLIGFDLLLIMVLALLLYSVSARDPQAPPGAFDVMQVALVVSALLANGFALWAILARISEYGFSPNRLAAMGVNLMLIVNLAWSAVLYIRFLQRRGAFAAVERWQTSYMAVYAIWATVVVVVFPPLIGFR